MFGTSKYCTPAFNHDEDRLDWWMVLIPWFEILICANVRVDVSWIPEYLGYAQTVQRIENRERRARLKTETLVGPTHISCNVLHAIHRIACDYNRYQGKKAASI